MGRQICQTTISSHRPSWGAQRLRSPRHSSCKAAAVRLDLGRSVCREQATALRPLPGKRTTGLTCRASALPDQPEPGALQGILLEQCLADTILRRSTCCSCTSYKPAREHTIPGRAILGVVWLQHNFQPVRLCLWSLVYQLAYEPDSLNNPYTQCKQNCAEGCAAPLHLHSRTGATHR